jgi:hypothetical protein
MDNRRRTLNDNISTIILLNVGTVPTVWYIFCSFYYSFIPMSGCVGMGPSALLFPGVRDAVKTALLLLLLSKKQ